MTDAQTAKAAEVTKRFGCGDDYDIIQRPFGRPPGYILVSMGTKKGRRRCFCVSPSGEVGP